MTRLLRVLLIAVVLVAVAGAVMAIAIDERLSAQLEAVDIRWLGDRWGIE